MKESLLPVNQRNRKERIGKEKKQQKETRKGVRRRGNEKMTLYVKLYVNPTANSGHLITNQN